MVIAWTTSCASSRRYGARLSWVCSASQGQPPGERSRSIVATTSRSRPPWTSQDPTTTSTSGGLSSRETSDAIASARPGSPSDEPSHTTGTVAARSTSRRASAGAATSPTSSTAKPASSTASTSASSRVRARRSAAADTASQAPWESSPGATRGDVTSRPSRPSVTGRRRAGWIHSGEVRTTEAVCGSKVPYLGLTTTSCDWSCWLSARPSASVIWPVCCAVEMALASLRISRVDSLGSSMPRRSASRVATESEMTTPFPARYSRTTGACTRAVRVPLGVSSCSRRAGSMSLISPMAERRSVSLMTSPSTTAARSGPLSDEPQPAVTSAAPAARTATVRRTERVTSCPFEVGPATRGRWPPGRPDPHCP